MEDAELRQQFNIIGQQFERIGQQFETIDRRFETIGLHVDQQFRSLADLIVGVKESLEREITVVRERVDRMDTRLDKIAAGAHYVTRLAEWSEVQDRFQLDILHRVQVLEERLNRLQNNGTKTS